MPRLLTSEIFLILFVISLWLISIIICLRRYSLFICFHKRDVPFYNASLINVSTKLEVEGSSSSSNHNASRPMSPVNSNLNQQHTTTLNTGSTNFNDESNSKNLIFESNYLNKCIKHKLNTKSDYYFSNGVIYPSNSPRQSSSLLNKVHANAISSKQLKANRVNQKRAFIHKKHFNLMSLDENALNSYRSQNLLPTQHSTIHESSLDVVETNDTTYNNNNNNKIEKNHRKVRLKNRCCKIKQSGHFGHTSCKFYISSIRWFRLGE